jgi:hypothetical protein
LFADNNSNWRAKNIFLQNKMITHCNHGRKKIYAKFPAAFGEAAGFVGLQILFFL